MVNKRALESLVKCGAFDSTGAARMGIWNVLEQAVGAGGRQQADRLAGQSSIFDLGGARRRGTCRPQAPSAYLGRRVGEERAAGVREGVLGLYVSEHPLQGAKESLRKKVDCQLAEVERRRDGEILTVGGIVGAIKALTTKKGEPMVFLRLDDLSGSIETVVFNSVYASSRDLLEADRVLVIKGRVDHKQEGETKLIAMEVAPFEATPERSEVRLKVDARKAPAGLLRNLADLVREYPGEAPVVVAIETSEGPRTYAFGPDFKVRPEADFFAEAKSLLGEAAVT